MSQFEENSVAESSESSAAGLYSRSVAAFSAHSVAGSLVDSVAAFSASSAADLPVCSSVDSSENSAAAVAVVAVVGPASFDNRLQQPGAQSPVTYQILALKKSCWSFLLGKLLQDLLMGL